jgi:cytochrome c-type biogenesis protein
VTTELASGSLLAAALVALVAGFVSFASPCVLPLVPGFLGYVTGLSDVSLEKRSRGRLVLGALLFVLGFTVVFLVAAAAVSAVGLAFREHQSALLRIGGAVVLVMGLLFLGVGRSYAVPVSWRPRAGLAGAPLLGLVDDVLAEGA